MKNVDLAILAFRMRDTRLTAYMALESFWTILQLDVSKSEDGQGGFPVIFTGCCPVQGLLSDVIVMWVVLVGFRTILFW